MLFKKAERKKVWLKIGLMGPSGSGKSFSALKLANGLAEGGPICALDTENGSLELYSNLANFDVAAFQPPFHAKRAVDAIREAAQAGYRVMIIDSQTHFWKQILEDKEKLDRAGGNSYTNWGKVKPQYEELKEAILHAPMHMICCLRAKDEYVIEKNERGKDAPRKVGMGAIAEPGAEFEYTTVFEIGMDHTATASKDRTTLFDGEIEKISEATGKRFLDWLAGGGEPAKIELSDRDVHAAFHLSEAESKNIKNATKEWGLVFPQFLRSVYDKGERTYDDLINALPDPKTEDSTGSATNASAEQEKVPA